jgi:NADPH:quinone reductase-like Zn-dependent oxidoreductase
VAVNLLSNLNFEVHAITGKFNEEAILKKMGVSKVIDRNKFMAEPIKALDKAVYSAGIDTVGGDILSKMLSMINSHGCVACC